MKKIIIDTDIGDDIDDAFAIALAARLKDVELVGVTTVFRNTEARAQLAERLLKTLGASVPVYAGEAKPYQEPVRLFERDGGEDALPCQWEEAYATPVTGGAVEFLKECAAAYGKELTIVAIGPMTNVARAIERYPAEMKGTGRIVSMGGSFTKFMPEWNYLCDPEAADAVIRSGIPFYAVGLDVTLTCPLEAGLMEKFASSPKEENKLLTLWLGRWFDYFHFEKSVMHDPLAVASVVSDVCTFEKRCVEVDLTDARGAVHVGEGSEIYVATKADKERFYAAVERALL